MLLACCGSALVICVLWLSLAQYLVGPFVWLSLFVVNSVCILASALLYFYWNSRRVAFADGSGASGVINVTVAGFTLNQNLAFLSQTATVTQDQVNLALGIFIAVVVITVVILLVTITMIRRIKMAIEIINEASRAFRKLPGIQLFPIAFSAATVVLFAYFVIIMLYIMTPTSSTVTISLLNLSFTNKNISYYMMWYHLFGFIWTFFTIEGMLNLSIAGAVAEW